MPASQSSSLKSMITQINVLNSKMQLIIQKLNKLESNFAVISRTVISQNNTIKEMDARVNSVESGEFDNSSFGSPNPEEISAIKEELKEMKYVIDSINPIAYVTVDEVADIINQKLLEHGIKSTKRKKK